MRRLPKAVATATGVAGSLLMLSGCGGVPVAAVPGADAFVVVSVDSTSYVFGLDARTPRGSATAELDAGGADPAASSVVGTDAEHGTVIAWNAENEPTRFAAVSADGTTVADLGFSLDTGRSAAAGGQLVSLLPVTGDGTSARLDVRTIGQQGSTRSVDVRFVPKVIDGDESRGFVLAAWDSGELAVQVLGLDGTLGPEARVPLGRFAVVGVQWGTSGAVVFVGGGGTAAGSAPEAPEVNPGVPLEYVKVGEATTFARSDGRIVAFDDVRDGIRVVRVQRIDGSEPSQIELAAEPLNGIRLCDDKHVIVLQDSRMTVWDPGTKRSENIDLPGATSTVWE